MSAQQRQHKMLGVDDRTQHAVAFLKTDELHIAVGFACHGAFQCKGARGVGVPQHPGGTRSPVKAEPGKTKQGQVLARCGGKEPRGDAVAHFGAKALQPVGHAARVGRVGGDLLHAEQRQLPFFGRADRRGNLPAGETFKDTAQKTGIAAVVVVGCIGHMRRVRHVSASSRTRRAAWRAATP